MTPVTRMLKEDHRKVEGLFKRFESLEETREKKAVVDEVLRELLVHAKLEEELVYPVLREEAEDEDTFHEASEEHHVVHVLIGELKKMSASAENFDAKVKVLAENVRHHVKEEESQVLPIIDGAEIDHETLAEEMMERKEQLMARMTRKNGSASASKKVSSRSSGPNSRKTARSR